MRNSFAGISQAKVRKVVVRTRLIGCTLAAEQNAEAWVRLNDDIQLLLRNGTYPRERKATGRMVHQCVGRRRKPKRRTGTCTVVPATWVFETDQ